MEHQMHLLVVTSDDKDWVSLTGAFAHSNWVMHRAVSPAAAIQFCQANDPAVVLCCRDVGNGGWRGLLAQLGRNRAKAPVVVFGRDADEKLWSDVLAAGGYDVLVVPFDKHEVLRIVTQAWRQWNRRHRQGEAVAAG